MNLSQDDRSDRVADAPGRYLSKSDFVLGLQCTKLLWTARNSRDQIPDTDAATQAAFDRGREVGALAKELFPDGLTVGEGVVGLEEAIYVTQEALNLRIPLFEATFAAEGGCCRVDLLVPAPEGAWDIIEVKSTTSLKDVHLDDLAFQAWLLTSSGMKIRACYVMRIDPEFVREGEIDPQSFFVKEDVTPQVSRLSRNVQDKLDEMFKTTRQRQCPDVRIGPHCDYPYTCPLHERCWAFLPDQNVLDLRRGRKKGFGLLDGGVRLLRDIPDDFKLTANQSIQKATAISGQPHVRKRAISNFLTRLQYPVYYLDFETFSTAIPMFDGVRPYQQIPFQFSLHIVREPGAKPEHVMFLAEGRHDPRPGLIDKLRNALGFSGSIVAYNAAFELGRMKECCEAMAEFLPWLHGVEDRVVDLLHPFRSFNFYHPYQHGSASMKAVLPALTGQGYEGLAIQEGVTASLEFLRVTFGNVDDAERQRVRRDLEAYCGQDTLGMVAITDQLRRMLD